MKKALLCIVLLFAVGSIFTSSAFAQSTNDDLHFEVGANLALPLGNFSNAYSVGFGGFVGVNKGITDEFVGFGQVGYDIFGGKTVDGISIPHSSILSIQAGAKYLLSDGFAIGVGLGYGSYHVGTTTVSDGNGGTISVGGGSTGGFFFAPMASYDLTPNLTVLASFNSLSVSGGSASFFKAGIAYKF